MPPKFVGVLRKNCQDDLICDYYRGALDLRRESNCSQTYTFMNPLHLPNRVNGEGS